MLQYINKNVIFQSFFSFIPSGWLVDFFFLLQSLMYPRLPLDFFWSKG